MSRSLFRAQLNIISAQTPMFHSSSGLCRSALFLSNIDRAAIKLGSLSNRASLVNNLLSLELYAGIRVVSAVGMTPPQDGRSRVRPPTVSCAVFISRNEPTEWPRPRPSRDIEIGRAKRVRTRLLHVSTYELAARSVGLNGVP